MQARPCQRTMERQTDEREEIFAEWAAYGKAFPANRMPYAIGNNQPIESKLQAAVSLLSHGRCRGALGIRAEHFKVWLRGAKKEEDPETAHLTLGLVRRGTSLFASALPFGTQAPFPNNVLGDCGPYSKGGGEYHGIRLLEPIWKVLKKVMYLRLEVIILHDSLHGCLALQGTDRDQDNRGQAGPAACALGADALFWHLYQPP
jgi:hypothetical protein